MDQFLKSDRARAVSVIRNGMNSNSPGLGEFEIHWSPLSRKRLKKRAGKHSRRIARQMCRRWLDR